MNDYQQLRFTCTRDQATALSEWLADLEATLAVSLLDAEDQPIYEPKLDTITLWEQVEVEALFANTCELEPILLALTAHLGHLPPYRLERLAERNWVEETQAQFPPQCFANRLWLYPVWHDIPAEHQPVLRLSPGLAFGTGTHPTTRLCLQWLAEHLKGGERVIDFGCGSGILGLAALILGAEQVYGVDLDPQALEASAANTALNAIPAERFDLALPADFQPGPPVDVLVANILASPIIDLAAHFHSLVKPGGWIVLSGILHEQMASVIDAYRPYIELTGYGQQEDWCALVGQRSA